MLCKSRIISCRSNPAQTVSARDPYLTYIAHPAIMVYVRERADSMYLVTRYSFVFLPLFAGLSCVVLLSYPTRWHFTCFTHSFATISVLFFL